MKYEIITVAIVDDHDRIRELLKDAINQDPGFRCEYTYSDGHVAIADFQEALPDAILMDIEMPALSGIECVRQIREISAEVPIVMFTHHDDNDSLFEALRAGATGYLVKGLPTTEILDAIRDAVDGGAPMSRAIAQKVVKSFRATPIQEVLSPRELEVLRLLCDGKTYTEVAGDLYLSKHTVRRHIRSIYEKLQVSSRAEMVIKAQKGGLTS